MKSTKKQYRFDGLTVQLLNELEMVTGRKQSELVRSAIYYYTKYELGEERFAQLLVNAADVNELMK